MTICMQNEEDIVVNTAEDLQRFHEKLHVNILKYTHGESDVEHEKARKGSRAPLLATLEERGWFKDTCMSSMTYCYGHPAS